jgi:hypothetical protein
MIIAAAFVMVSLLSGCDDMGPVPSSNEEEPESKPKARKAAANEPLPKAIDVDPNSLAPEKREYYDKGCKQGLHIADNYCKEAFKDGKPGADEVASYVKKWLQERDVAIQVALIQAGNSGAENSEVLLACGRKAGFKEGLAKHSIPLP